MGGLFLHERVSWGQEWVDQLSADTWMNAFSFGAAQQQQAEGERRGWQGGGKRGCRDMHGNSGVGSAAGSAAAGGTRGSMALAEDTSGGDGAADVIQVLLDASHGTAEVTVGVPVHASAQHSHSQALWVRVKLLLTVADHASNRLTILVPVGCMYRTVKHSRSAQLHKTQV
ncbi:hypothetical protein CLOM_g24537 [Closterium sp. NIES-68]|nr:hypothetical protein CLOM_g24537 [Closterium sp. NIES-68]GJP70988.1 hypothetical protein CLOP_g1880 [Closterium sp. NIES-67]